MEEDLTVDELARRAGTTTRNVRAHQGRGLLQAPRMVGRVAYYNNDHLARLGLIAELQERGFSLAAIADLLRAHEAGSSLADVLGLEDVLTAPWSDEAQETISRERLEELFPEIVEDPGLLQRSVDLGLLIPEGEDFRAPSPALVRHGVLLTGVGIPLPVALDQAAALKADTAVIAGRFLEVFRTYLWEPAFAGNPPVGRLAQLTEAVQLVRPLAFEVVRIFLAQAMEQAMAAALAEEYERAEGSR
ncbi:MAG: MerR family transcriptional regulator [Actinomycetota bacterium]